MSRRRFEINDIPDVGVATELEYLLACSTEGSHTEDLDIGAFLESTPGSVVSDIQEAFAKADLEGGSRHEVKDLMVEVAKHVGYSSLLSGMYVYGDDK